MQQMRYEPVMYVAHTSVGCNKGSIHLAKMHALHVCLCVCVCTLSLP